MLQPLYVALLSLILVSNTVSTNDNNLKKRSLDWLSNYTIRSSNRNAPDIVVTHLKSHANNVRQILTNQVYMAFVLYKRNGAILEPNGGIFHFTELETAFNNVGGCQPRTNHSGAYKYFYGRCPNEDHSLVASGYCYRRNGLVYNSATFNNRRPYTDDRYYNIRNDRSVHEIEQALLNDCYNRWRNSEFQTTGWECDVRDLSKAQFQALTASLDTGDQCCECCDGPCSTSGGISLGPWPGKLGFTMMFLFVLLHF